MGVRGVRGWGRCGGLVVDFVGSGAGRWGGVDLEGLRGEAVQVGVTLGQQKVVADVYVGVVVLVIVVDVFFLPIDFVCFGAAAVVVVVGPFYDTVLSVVSSIVFSVFSVFFRIDRKGSSTSAGSSLYNKIIFVVFPSSRLM